MLTLLNLHPLLKLDWYFDLARKNFGVSKNLPVDSCDFLENR